MNVYVCIPIKLHLQKPIGRYIRTVAYSLSTLRLDYNVATLTIPLQNNQVTHVEGREVIVDNTNTTEYRKGGDTGSGFVSHGHSWFHRCPLSWLVPCPSHSSALQLLMAQYLIRQSSFSFGNSSSMGWSGHLISYWAKLYLKRLPLHLFFSPFYCFIIERTHNVKFSS